VFKPQYVREKERERERDYWLSMVVHICNPSYSGGRSGRSWFEASLGKNKQNPILMDKLGVAACAGNAS
jgi:hypothetical protein